MSRVHKAITTCFFFLHLFSSINVVSFFFRECMPVESPFPPLFPQILDVCVCVWCVCVWVGGQAGGCASSCQCM